MDLEILKKIGFSDKYAQVYLALLRQGPSSVRGLSEIIGINRGTTYDALKWLESNRLVTLYEKEAKQYFVAEDPERLHALLEQRATEVREAERALTGLVGELKSLYHKGVERPVSRYFEKDELHSILEDVLETCEKRNELLYRIYSTVGIREYLYDQFPTFSDVRVAKGIRVNVIAVGDGGELRGLDERKWLKTPVVTPTYVIIYPGKTASISLDSKGEPMGVVIENEGVFELQKTVFEQVWATL
jgi:sugar-specific transcriptional regulator TrmB